MDASSSVKPRLLLHQTQHNIRNSRPKGKHWGLKRIDKGKKYTVDVCLYIFSPNKLDEKAKARKHLLPTALIGRHQELDFGQQE